MEKTIFQYDSSSGSASESPPPKKDHSTRDSDKYRRKDRDHENKSRDRHRSSRDDNDKSGRHRRDDSHHRKSSHSRSRHDGHRHDSGTSKHKDRKSDRYHSKDKYDRRNNDKKYKKHEKRRSKTPEKSRRRSSSSSQEREKKASHVKADNLKPAPIAAPIQPSPQKSLLISLGSASMTISPLPNQSSEPPKVEPKIELPSYYNPSVINVTKFADQQKKRKLLWSGKKDEANEAAKWASSVKFSQDTDGTKANKFMRLMGIKDAPKPETSSAAPKPSDEMFSTMEQQYETARMATHIARGVGLGFSSRPF